MSKSDEFDFDTWARLAKDDPETFEAMRQNALQQLIDKAPAPSRPRLQGIQWQVDQLRQRTDSPMAACVQISQMMWNSVLGERGLLDALESPGKWATRGTPSDNVVPLHTPESPQH